MHALILAAALSMLPAGRGEGASAALDVVSLPAGAQATATFRDPHGAPKVDTCVTPCTLHIAQRSPFVLEVVLGGKELPIQPVGWKPTLLGAKLHPATIYALANH